MTMIPVGGGTHNKLGSFYAVETFTADGTGAFTPVTISDIGGTFIGISVVYGGTPPDALSVTVDDSDGIDMLNGGAAVITENTRVSILPPQRFSGGMTINLTGNTTAGAEVTIKAFFI